MADNITTIKLSRKTKERLEHLRVYKRETYEEILEKMLDILNICRVSPAHARMGLIKIDRQRKEEINFKKGVHFERAIDTSFSDNETKLNGKLAQRANKSQDKITREKFEGENK